MQYLFGMIGSTTFFLGFVKYVGEERQWKYELDMTCDAQDSGYTGVRVSGSWNDRAVLINGS